MSGQVKQINNALFGKINTTGSTKSAKNVVTNTYSGETTSGQTVIDLGFSVEVGVTDSNFLLFINGVKLTQGSDFNFTNLSGNRTSEVTLTSPAIDGLSIEALLLNIAVSGLNALQIAALVDAKVDKNWVTAGFQNFIEKEEFDAPHTEIVNREKVTRGLSSNMGVDRLSIKGLTLSINEQGPNGEPVYDVAASDNRIKLVGSDWVAASSNFGSYVQADKVDSFIEITFFGTGLNILTIVDAGAVDVRPTIDGGAEGSNIFTGIAPASNVLNSRNYGTNQVVEVVSGLALDWHTIKLRPNNLFLTLYGIEIVNDSNQITTLPGESYINGVFNNLTSNSLSDYKPAGMGSAGGRVVKYLKDGVINEVFTSVGSPLYITSADHSNEEVARRINWREFGVNRGDDFSSLGTGTFSNRYYTLDDGTTSLVAYRGNVTNQYGNSALAVNGAGDQWAITFVGTGLDIVMSSTATSGGTADIRVNGTTVSTSFALISNKQFNTYKICSGLPYGTHTVFLDNSALTGVAGDHGLHDFIIYQPKKPTIPSDALEVADYNVMADFSFNSDFNEFSMSTGVLSKNALRELVYNGNWVAGTNFVDHEGSYATGNTANNYFEYKFYGTGIGYRWVSRVDGSTSVNIEIDGQDATSANFPSATFDISSQAGIGYNSTTGILDTRPNANGGTGKIMISGLDLGWHTVRMTTNNAEWFDIHALQIITPIHINDPSFKIGNQGLSNNEDSQPIVESVLSTDMQKAKAWVIYDQSTNRIIDSHNVAQAIDAGTGDTIVLWDVPFKRVPALSLGQELERVMLRKVSGQGTGLRDTHGVAIVSRNSSGAAQDSVYVAVVAYGELVNE